MQHFQSKNADNADFQPYQGVPILHTELDLLHLANACSFAPVTGVLPGKSFDQDISASIGLSTICTACAPVSLTLPVNRLLISLHHLELSEDLAHAKSRTADGEILTLVTTKYAGREFLTRDDGMIYKGDTLFSLKQLQELGIPTEGIQAPPFSETGSFKDYTCLSVFSWLRLPRPETTVPLSHVSACVPGSDQTLHVNTDLSTTCITFQGRLRMACISAFRWWCYVQLYLQPNSEGMWVGSLSFGHSC